MYCQHQLLVALGKELIQLTILWGMVSLAPTEMNIFYNLLNVLYYTVVGEL